MIRPQKSLVSIRVAAEGDVPTLVTLNRTAYPDLAEQEVVFTHEQLVAHTRTFPAGQQVAEVDGIVVGAIATLVVPPTFDPLAAHSWSQATDDGRFTNHDPLGDTLYLADIYVAEAAWGRGVGTALYAALRNLARSLNMARVVAGGRLWGYGKVSSEMSPEQYVAEVVAGRRVDRVLTSQIKAGFRARGILSSYLPDPKSCDFASMLEWRNPDVVERQVHQNRTLPTEATLEGIGG